MKKIYCCIISVILILLCQSCKQKENSSSANPARKPVIAASIEPVRLILNEIAGSNFVIKTIIPANASPHTYEPNPADIKLLNEAEAIFYVSDNLDGWIGNMTKNSSANKINLMNLVAKNNAVFDNSAHMAHEQHQAHSHAHSDPHFWTAPLSVKAILNDICNSICKMDTKNASMYKNKTLQFATKLDALHNEIASKLTAVKGKPIFTAHNSFGYFINEFGLTTGGAIEESPGKEASPKYIANIISKIKTAKINRIFAEPQLNAALIQTIAKEANVKIDTLHPLNSPNANSNYFDFIKQNAEIFLQLKY